MLTSFAQTMANFLKSFLTVQIQECVAPIVSMQRGKLSLKILAQMNILQIKKLTTISQLKQTNLYFPKGIAQSMGRGEGSRKK